MTTITNLAKGASQDVTFTYTVKESDAGKSISNTITAISGTAQASATSAAVSVMEPVTSMQVTASAIPPSNGLSYGANETITFNCVIKNTGNTVLNNIRVNTSKSPYIDTVKIIQSSGYTIDSSNIATINTINPNNSVTIIATSKQLSPDLSGSMGNQYGSFTVTGENVEQVTVETSRFMLMRKIASTQEEFDQLSWTQLKAICTEVMTGVGITYDDIKPMGGFTKNMSITFDSKAYECQAQLVSIGTTLAYRPEGNNIYCPMTFMPLPIYGTLFYYKNGLTSTKNPGNYADSQVKTVSSSAYNAIESSVRSLIRPAKLIEVDQDYLYGLTEERKYNEIGSYNCYAPSHYELTGIDVYGKEGIPFTHGSKIKRIKAILTSSNYETGAKDVWWLRTRFLDSSSSTYKVFRVSSAGVPTAVDASSSKGRLAFCFNL